MSNKYRPIPEATSRPRLINFIKKHQDKIDLSTSPGGSNTQVQYNDAGSFGASNALTFDSSTHALRIGTPDSTNGHFQVYNDGGYPLVNIENNGNQYPTAMFTVISGAEGPGLVGVGTSVPKAVLHVSSSTTGSVFRLDSTDSDNSSLLYVSASNDIGIAKDTPKIHLDVNHGYLDWLADDTGGGESVTFGSAGGVSLTTGKIYFLKNDGVWTQTDADSKTTGGNQLLGIALGTDPTSDGMLLRGFFKASTAVSDWDEGKPVYLSTTAGLGTTTAPSATGDFVRIVGYCTATTDIIYFNPSSTYVEIS